MTSQQLMKPRNWILIYLSWAIALSTIVAGFTSGPKVIYLLALIGLLLSMVVFVTAVLSPEKFPPKKYAFIFGAIFTGFIIVGLILDGLFLRPLEDSKLTIPPLDQRVTDTKELYSFRIPNGWTWEHKSTIQGEGIIIRPSTKSDYMGVSELQVFIRPSETFIKKPEKLLDYLSQQLTHNRSPKEGKKGFELKTEPAKLLDGSSGAWSIINTNKLWIPVTQVTLMGVKNHRFICTVSAMGLSSHSTLYKVLCLGVYQTIKKNPTSH